MKFASSTVAVILFVVSSLVDAVPVVPQEITKMSAEGLFLLRLGPNLDPVWKTEEEKWALKKAGIDFMDVTETWLDMESNPALKTASKDASIMTTCTLYPRAG